MKEYSNIIITIGIFLIIVGILIKYTNIFHYFGKLPGDICIKKENFVFYFPITSMIIISIVINLILKIFKR
jgi:hypothetical protein